MDQRCSSILLRVQREKKTDSIHTHIDRGEGLRPTSDSSRSLARREKRLSDWKNQLLEKESIVFIVLTRAAHICRDDELCRGARLCSKEFFLIGAVLSSHSAPMYIYTYIHICVCVCVQSLLFLSSQECPRRRGEERKKESEDIERSIGRTARDDSERNRQRERWDRRNEKEQLLLLLIWISLACTDEHSL